MSAVTPQLIGEIPLRSSDARAPESLEGRLLAASFLIFFALNATLAFRMNINWDEYFYLSHIYSAQYGRSLEPLQTIHVQLLGWLTQVPLHEADQVLVGRLFMLLCQAISVVCLYRVALEFADRRDAALAALAYVASGFVLAHGISFRADPLAGMLMMTMLALLFCAPLKGWVATAAGLLAALAFLVTIKVVFLIPAVGAAFLWRWSRAGSVHAALAHFAITGIAAAAAGAALFFFHAESLASAATSATDASSMVRPAANLAANAFDMVILSQSLFPRSVDIVRWFLLSPLPLILVALGSYSALARFREGGPLQGTAMMCLLLPLVSLTFYRNAFPYFFPFIFLPTAILAAVGSSRLTRPTFRNAFIAAMVLVLVSQAAVLWQRDQSAQRSVARAAHMIFPEPVPYVDRNGMLPSFPKANQFMSTWGVEGMLAMGVPALRPIIESRHPPLLIENSPVLSAALEPSAPYVGNRLHPADEEVLRNGYVQHWGPIWVAGKNLDEASGSFALSIPGTYTLECSGSRTIDGRSRKCGSTVSLNQGAHEWSRGSAVIRWGEHLPRPSGPPPEKPIYYGF